MPNTDPSLPTGTLTTAGAFTVHDEPTTGFVVSCSREEIQSLSSLPMYQRVAIVPVELVEDFTVRASDYDRLVHAAVALRAACRSSLPPGSYALLDTACAEIDAILSPKQASA